MEPIEIEIIRTNPTTPKLRQQLRLNLILGLIYLSCLLGLLSVILLIPNSPASSESYYSFYFTHNFEPCKIFYFFSLIFSGKFFLQSVVLKSLLKNSPRRIGGGSDNLWVFCCGLFAFFFGANATLSASSDSVSYTRALINDFFAYTLPYFLFLHSAYAVSGVLIEVNLSFGELYRVSKKSFVLSFVILLTLVGLCGYQLFLLYLYSRLLWYIIAYSVIASVGFGTIYVSRRSYEFNLFSVYCLAAIPLTATPGITSQILQGSLLGLFLENSVRIGLNNLIIKA